MSDKPDPESPHRPSHHGTSKDRSSLGLVITAILAVIAIGLAGWALLRPARDSAKAESYSDSQRADAKRKVCAAFQLVSTGVSRNTNLAVPGGPDDVAGNLAVTANARLALYGGGQYLLARLEPATPQELADTARGFANTLFDTAAAATAGAQGTDPEQAARLRDADAANTKLGGLCK